MSHPDQHVFRRWPRIAARMLGHALLPSSCALCAARCQAAVCLDCRAQFLGAQAIRCCRCANPLGALDAGLPCASCQSHPPAYDATIVAADYGAPLDQLVLQLKFGGVLALAPWFGQALAEAAARAGMAGMAGMGIGALTPDLLCPVPLGPQRLVERGFNQALEIARPLARSLGVAIFPALAVRARETTAQSMVAPADRQKNIRNAFMLAPDGVALVRGKHIGVVDDVMTSGATLNEVASVFKRFGAARVSNFVFARTPPH